MDSKTVFELRNEAKELNGINKVNKLNEALQISNNLYQSVPYDEWIQKAFAWVLVDLCKYYMSANNLNQALIHFKQLNNIEFNYPDNIIESQKTYLKPRIDTNYQEINKAEELSKNNKNEEALNIFKQLISENRLNDLHHEAYGWVIYRHIKNDEKELTSIQVRTFLRDYMNLKNERPSLLHSLILNFALHYSKEHSDFNLYKFFELWNPENLRPDDKSKQWYNDKEIPSLISRVFRTFIDNKYNIDCQFLLSNVKINSGYNDSSSEQQVLDLLREPYFWQIFNAKKGGNHSIIWQLFNNYNLQFSIYPKSKWHSEILSLAERYLQESDEWRFLEFFESWNPTNFMDEDWKEVVKEENTYKPLAIKCLKKSFEIIKAQKDKTHKTDWLIDVYDIATNKLPNDEWLEREKAILLIEAKEFSRATEIYKSLVLGLGDKAYIWYEFSSCINNNNELKIGMLSKAIQLEKNEDFLGDIHLELAKTLIDIGLSENALVELNTYKKHRELKSWNLSETYISLLSKIADKPTSIIDNRELYNHYIPLAEEYAYQDIEWTELVLIDTWKTDKQKEKLKFSNSKEIEFSVSKKRFKSFKEFKIGNIFDFKLHKEEKISEVSPNRNSFLYQFSIPKIEYKYIPLLSKQANKPNWSILEDEFAVIDYINKEKKVIHAISSKNQELFFKDDISKYNINDFIKGKLLVTKRKDETRIDLKKIEIIDSTNGVEQFPKVLAVVDNVNKEKKLFHFVADRKIHGIVRFNETDLRPKEGSFLEIWFAKKIDKKRNRVIYKPLKIIETEEINEQLRKNIIGSLELKFKSGGYTRDFYELDEDERFEIDADFGFISDFYVPKYILKKYSINSNCQVKAKAIFSGDKWKIIELERDE
jgi:hypothetical protein